MDRRTGSQFVKKFNGFIPFNLIDFDIIAESVAYLVCRRKGLISNAAKYLKEYQTQNRELPVLGFNGVLQAASYIEGMGKSKWKKPKKTR